MRQAPERQPTDDAEGSSALPAARPAIRSYVVRPGRMGPGQERALRQFGPRFMVAPATRVLDLGAAFGRSAPVVVEIGFGMGAATAAIASARPDLNFLGIEVHPPGIGALLKTIGAGDIGNVRIVAHDAVEVLRDMIEPNSLAGINIFFPDPWPKKRHHKRRLLQAPFVSLLASRLQSGGLLHCATDWAPYAEQMLAVLSGQHDLVNTAAAFADRPSMRPLTKFEQRGLDLGHSVRDLLFVKR